MHKKRVVITGLGLITSIGNNIATVTSSLFTSKSGIDTNQNYIEKGLSSHISGQLPNAIELIGEKKITRFMSEGAGYSYLSMIQAIEDAHLPSEIIHSSQTGLIVGTGGGSPASTTENSQRLDSKKGFRSMIPTYSARCMASSPSANLAVLFGIHGISFSLSSACATSAHTIGEAFDKISNGRLNTVFAGGCDECDVYVAATFDRARALSRHNSNPQKASRPYDANRDGFVASGGAGIIVLEEMNQAIERGAKIYAEIIGYGASSDGSHMTIPSGDGAIRAMQQAIDDCPDLKITDIDYINTHGTSTIAGDIIELQAIEKVFGNNIPLISSTKSLTGHGFGAAGVHEIIYSIIMMENNFIATSENIDDIDIDAAHFPIVRKRLYETPKIVLSNSFGFGGTNATLIIKKFN